MELLSIKFWQKSLLIGIKAAYQLIKLMIPVVILVKILERFGITDYMALAMEPLMEVIGLPAWTAIVWAVAILSNLYAGLAVLASSEGFSELTGAQMSVLATGMLIAHSLPVEARITQALGVKFGYMVATRLVGAFILCFILNTIYTAGGWLSHPVVISWEIPVNQLQDANFFTSLLGEVVAMASLSAIVVVMVVAIEVLKVIKVVHYCEVLLQPILRFMGISNRLSHIMAVSALLGLTYGSGALIAESKQQNFNKKDLAIALVFISMCHALLEDSLITILSGAHISAVFFARLIFCILLASVLMRWSHLVKLKFHK